MENIFIVWTSYQARVEGITRDLGIFLGDFQLVYRENPPAKRFKKIIQYVKYFFSDLRLIMNSNPKRVFVQIPPSYSLVAPVIIKKVFRKKIKIIADCHNAMTRNPWLTRVGSRTLIKNADLIILHNNVVYRRKSDFFPYISNEKVIVLEDKTIMSNNTKMVPHLKIAHPFVFIPSSFNLDEPVREVVRAASLSPEIKFVLTGNPNKLKSNFSIDEASLPENLILTGWLTNNEYNQYLIQADILMGLTIYDDIQMSVSNEGLGAGKVMILSDKLALREIYKDGVIYTKNNFNSICSALKIALQNRDVLIPRIKRVRVEKEDRYQSQIKTFIDNLNKN